RRALRPHPLELRALRLAPRRSDCCPSACMNQTRMLLLFAWLAVATLLYMEWTKEHAPAAIATTTSATNATTAPSAAIPSVPTATSMPASTPTAPGSIATATPSAAPVVTVNTDLLRLTLDGGSVHTA